MKKLLLVVFLLLPNFAFGQVNIESIRTGSKSDDLIWGEVKGGLEIQRGNVDITSMDLSLNTHFKASEHHIFFQGKTARGMQSGETFKNASFGHLRWTWMPWQSIGAEIFTQIQHDEFKSLQIRHLKGVGLRSEFFHYETFKLSIGTGVMTDYEQIDSDQRKTDVRSTSYLSLIKSFGKKKKNLIMATIYYQPLFDNPEDYRINLEANLRTVLISSWNILLDNSINFLYDTRPPEGILTNDLIVKTSLVYSW